MKMRRLIASMSAGFEDFVTKVENHEAVAECMIDEVREATAQVRVQRARVQAHIDRFEKQLAELEADETRWNERALTLADSDESRALQCVGRARQAASRRGVIATQLEQHRALAEDLRGRLMDLEQRLSDLQLKKTALSSRAARTQAVKASQRCGRDSAEAVFDRWETAVVTDEYRDDVDLDGGDPLERQFQEQETTAELKARLEELKARHGGEQ